MAHTLRPVLRAFGALLIILIAVPSAAALAQGAGQHEVGDSIVEYTDRWEYNSANPSTESIFLTHHKVTAASFTYTETSELGASSEVAALDGMIGDFDGVLDDGSARVLLKGMSGGTTAWRLVVATVSGVPLAVVMTANLTSQPGTAVLSLLTAPAGSMDIVLEDAREIRVDAMDSPISRLDAELIVETIEADEAGLSPATGGAVVNGVDYRELDAPSGCDRIGWAITDPSQLPASEAELAQRGACAGGVSWVAKCGTVEGERADQRYITCTVTALVGSGPQEFSPDMFALVAADGTSEYIDFGMAFGNDGLFPPGPVQVGVTMTGTAPFVIDTTEAEPLLLEIRPPSLPAGTEPAVIVIEGPLQPLAVFD